MDEVDQREIQRIIDSERRYRRLIESGWCWDCGKPFEESVAECIEANAHIADSATEVHES